MVKLDHMRLFLLFGWLATAAMVVLAYLVTYVYEPVQAPTRALSNSFMTVFGLLAPHLTVAANTVFGKDRSQFQEYVERSRAVAMTVCCLTYWSLLVGAVWLTVVGRRAGIADGTGIETATTLVVAIGGCLSFLAVIPTSHVFTGQRKRNSPAKKIAAKSAP